MVEFISYTGKAPELCKGRLTLRIDGEVVAFQPFSGDLSVYEKFWFTGGRIYYDEEWRQTKGPWTVDVRALPEKYQKYADEIEKLLNDRIPQGCCGGCVRPWV